MADNDWLEGYTLSELLGAAPVSKSPKQIKKQAKAEAKAAGKRGLIAMALGAPIRLVAGLVKLPVSVVTKLVQGMISAVTELFKLPVRIASALVSPWRKKS